MQRRLPLIGLILFGLACLSFVVWFGLEITVRARLDELCREMPKAVRALQALDHGIPAAAANAAPTVC